MTIKVSIANHNLSEQSSEQKILFVQDGCEVHKFYPGQGYSFYVYQGKSIKAFYDRRVVKNGCATERRRKLDMKNTELLRAMAKGDIPVPDELKNVPFVAMQKISDWIDSTN